MRLLSTPAAATRCRRLRPQQQAQASLVKQLVLGAAATAAIGVTAVTVHNALQQRRKQQQEDLQHAQHPRDGWSGSEGSEGSSEGGGWLRLPQPAWGTPDKDQQLAQQVGCSGRCRSWGGSGALHHSCTGASRPACRTSRCLPLHFVWDANLQTSTQPRFRHPTLQVQDIEQLRQREAAEQLRQWDLRWTLRSKPLTELRALAAKHGVAGRSCMRKQELLAALESRLDLVDSRQGAAAAAAERRRPGAP